VQPIPFSADIDPGFIGMDQIGCRQLIFHPSFKDFQAVKRIPIEVVDGSRTDRDLHLVRKMILYPIILGFAVRRLTDIHNRLPSLGLQ
jgi:hypothetical protein